MAGRAISGRWFVVADQLDGDEHEPRYAWVRGREASEELVRQWRRDIEEHGRNGGSPSSSPGRGVPPRVTRAARTAYPGKGKKAPRGAGAFSARVTDQ